jgi:hypothetical protein
VVPRCRPGWECRCWRRPNRQRDSPGEAVGDVPLRTQVGAIGDGIDFVARAPKKAGEAVSQEDIVLG